MNFHTLKQQLAGLSYDEQVARLKEVTRMTDEEIPDFINWMASFKPLVPEYKPKNDDRMAETLERCLRMAEEARKNPPPVKENGLTPFERDILHNRFLLGASTIHDEASYHHPNPRQTESFRWLRNEFHGCGKSFALLLGGTGAGKTFAALAYVNLIANVEVNVGKIQNTNVAYVHAYKLADMLHNSKKYGTELETITRKGILLLDDLGAEPVGYRGKDFEAHFHYLIDERYKCRRKTLMTSNTTVEGFKELYGERVSSRFSEIGAFLQTSDPDLRRA